jgi:hypothetical protein
MTQIESKWFSLADYWGIFGDTWTWDGTDWKLESQTGSPGDSASHAMAYDAQMQRDVMFGTSSDTKALNDTWTLEWNCL